MGRNDRFICRLRSRCSDRVSIMLSGWPPVYEQNFLLRVSQSSNQPVQRRQDTAIGFLNSNGEIVQRCQSGSNYVLRNGKLASDSLPYSTSGSLLYAPFRATQTEGAITSIFSVDDGYLVWKNATFDGGAARFAARQSQPLLVVFSGPLPEGYSDVKLGALASAKLSKAYHVSSLLQQFEPDHDLASHLWRVDTRHKCKLNKYSFSEFGGNAKDELTVYNAVPKLKFLLENNFLVNYESFVGVFLATCKLCKCKFPTKSSAVEYGIFV
ncbi:MAG: hypothetical protein Q9182_000273 [Xanthomendoza sp. 2 TL-2023]